MEIIMNKNNQFDIMRSIHQKMSKKYKIIIVDNLLKSGFKELLLKDVLLEDSHILSQIENNSFATNVKFEKNKEMLNVDLVIKKDNVIHLCDLKFTKKVDRIQIIKELKNLETVKDWLKENKINHIEIASYYWGKQKKLKPVKNLLNSYDFCKNFNIDLNQIEEDIKLTAECLLKDKLKNIKNNTEGFKLLMSEDMNKYKTARELEKQNSLF